MANNITATDATTLPAFITTAPKRTRRRNATGSPIVRSIGARTVAVSLFGSHGTGREMLLDRDVWEDVRERIGACWTVNYVQGGRYAYVRSSQGAAARAAMQRGKTGKASLSRIVMGAMPGDVVAFRSEDRLDLRRANMEKLSRAEAAHFRAAHALV